MDDEPIFRALMGRASEAEVAAVEAWRRALPEHERRYHELAALLDLSSRADADRMAARARPRTLDLVGHARARWSSHRRFGVAVAAVLLCATGLSVWKIWDVARPVQFGAEEFVTGQAETATVTLKDGSVVRLAPQSRFRVEDQADGRSVFLRGRAYFAVAPRAESLFHIRTPSGNVTVLGTRFDLEAGGEDLRVLVLQGRVALSTGRERREVSAGEMGRIVNGTLPVVAHVAEMDRLVDWKGNFLAFQSTPLREAAREIERQFGVAVRITDPALAERTVTSWFAGWTVTEVLEVVCAITHARCVAQAGVVTVTPEPVLRPGR